MSSKDICKQKVLELSHFILTSSAMNDLFVATSHNFSLGLSSLDSGELEAKPHAQFFDCLSCPRDFCFLPPSS